MKKETIWEIIGYVLLAGLVIGQVTIGYWYLFAQFVYLICNITNVVRDFAQNMPTSYKVKDICFSALTLALIIIWVI
jgi:hypothetical protein